MSAEYANRDSSGIVRKDTSGFRVALEAPGRALTRGDLYDAIMEGAVERFVRR
jgi:hypothetical protein